MSSRKWLDNAFWENDEKDEMSCILELEDDAERQTRQVMRLKKFDKDGNPNPDFEEVVEVLGEELITQNTEDRKTRNLQKKRKKKFVILNIAKGRKMEELFNYKMEVFEVEEIKNCKDRKLKGKLRRAKSKIEVDLYAIMIFQKSLEEEENGGEE